MSIITLLTDFGTRDPYVGIMKGVIFGIHPEARLVDLTHQVVSGDLAQAGFLLATSWRWFPEGTVHLAVVDPGVGTGRRPLAARADGHYFVGPDNGLFTAVLDQAGEVSVRELRDEAWRLPEVSRTFHGRDIFAPAAAWLARGTAFEQLGPALDRWVRAHRLRTPREEDGALCGELVQVDRFGNLVTSISRRRMDRFAAGPAGLALEWDGGSAGRLVGTYAEAPDDEPVMLVGSSGYLEIAVNRGSAAERTGLKLGDAVRLVRRERDGAP